MKKLIKKFFVKYRNRKILNYYQTDYKKRVLISYIPYPFREKKKNNHTNYQESLLIAETFHQMGYIVDIFYQEDESKINYRRYDVVFGVGDPLENSFYFNYQGKPKPLQIYYGLGRQIIVNNAASLQRVEDFYNKYKLLLLGSARIGKKAWQAQTTLADAIVTLGNETTKNSYQQFFKKQIYTLSVTYLKFFDYKKIIADKNFSKAKKHFLWIGGAGLLHKGLDVILEYFVERQDLHLHICGPVKNEKDFNRFYHRHLYETKNIHTYGFVDISSFQFEKILKQVAFLISATASEGQPSSLVNVMANAGLIPIFNKESAISLRNFSIPIEKINHSSLEKAIEKSQSLSNDFLKEQSYLIAEEILEEHSLKMYQEKLNNYLSEIIGNYEKK